MVAGSTGSGKTTFLNTLCDKGIVSPPKIATPEEAILEKTVVINTSTIGTFISNLKSWTGIFLTSYYNLVCYVPNIS